MSGGSYNYLCFGILSERQDDLKRMLSRLEAIAGKHVGTALGKAYADAAERTAMILAALDVPEALSAAWKAVEWRDSNDWGEDQMDEEILGLADQLSIRTRPRVRITTGVLDALKTGRHDLAAVGRARDVLTAAGCAVELHPMEAARITELREQAARLAGQADQIEGLA